MASPQEKQPSVIPPDPPPPPPDAAPDEEQKVTPSPPTPRRDLPRESRPDVGEVRHVPRTPDPPAIIGRRSRGTTIYGSSSTSSVAPAAYRGFDLLITGR